MTKPTTVTAAVLVIGDEILSGRTKDRNLGYIAEYLAKIGVDVREARVVPDVEDEIVAALNALRARYDYVVTTGGIGPTHDDITADSVGRAFGVPDRRGSAGRSPSCLSAMRRRSHAGAAPHGAHPARRRTSSKTRFPWRRFSHRQRVCPGRRAGGHAGHARLRRQDDEDGRGDAGRDDRGGQPFPEGLYGEAFGAIAAAHPNVAIGSYPSFKDGRFNNQIVVRGKDEEAVAAARRAVEAMVAELSGDAAAR